MRAENGKRDKTNKAAPASSARELGGYALTALFVVFEVVTLFSIGYLLYEILAGETIEAPGGVTLNLFHFLPLVLVLSWLCLLVGYFAWGTYFYNYNFGRSAGFWKKFVRRTEEAESEGKGQNDIYDEMAAPRQNPYADQTFGLPPGTVRGSLALTIVVGGLALVIGFIGGNAFLTDEVAGALSGYYEFFQTAFLMVIAFYFGTKGLDIIERERTRRAWTSRLAGRRTMTEDTETALSRMRLDGRRPGRGDGVGDSPEPDLTASSSSDELSIPEVEQRIPAAAPAVQRVVEKIHKETIETHYPHVADLAMDPALQDHTLNDSDLEQVANDEDLELALVRAVVEVESSGEGFLSDGRPKILFEGHIFWRQLKKFEIDPQHFAILHPSIVYRTWREEHYIGGKGEYRRLKVAKQIHETAALCSASWGLFQIMGFNHATCGFSTVQEFVKAHQQSEREHLKAFFQFLKNRRQNGRSLQELLSSKDWEGFSRAYNGPGYKKNRYDSKLKTAYERYSASNSA